MQAGTLTVELMADIARLSSDMKKAEATVNHSMGAITKYAEGAKTALGAIGIGLSAGAFVNFVKHAIDAGDELSKLSQRTGIATEQLSQLRYAAKLADVSNEALTGAFRKLNVSIADSLAGDKQKAASFKAIGITQKDLEKGTLETMLKISDAYAHAKDGPGKVENAVRLLGKAGDEMIPLLNGGRGAITDLMQEANRLGLTIGSDFAEQASEFNDNLARINSSSQHLAIVLGQDVVSALSKAMQAFIDAGREGGKFHQIMEGLNTLFYGDDRHMANVQIVDLTNQIIGTMDQLDKARERERTARDVDKAQETASVERLQKRLAALNKEMETHKNYAKMLDDQQAKDKAAADAAKAARTNGVTIPGAVATGDDGTKQYEALIKRIRERIEAEQMEIAVGRQLTDEEKFAVKTRAEAAELVRRYPGLSVAKVTAMLQESDALRQQIDIRNADLASAKIYAEYWAKTNAELAAFDKARADERDRVLKGIADQSRTLADSNALLKLEAAYIGASDQARQDALGALQIELDTKHKIEEINQNLLLTEQARALAIAGAQKNAADQLAQLHQRSQLQETKDFADDLHGSIRDALIAGFRDGKNPALAFIENFANALYNRVSTKLADALTNAVLGQGGGGLGGLGGLGALSGLFGGGGAVNMGTGYGSVTTTLGDDIGLMYAGNHSGGIVGMEATFMRALHSSTFDGAPRFHTGGLVGDEVPLIAQKGEGVFTAGQMRALGSGGGGSVTLVQNITTSDVASTAMVRAEMKRAQNANIAALQRARNYGTRGF